MSSLDRIFKAYDIRGLSPGEFSGDDAFSIGAAFASLIRDEDPAARRVLIARDMRETGVELAARFAQGVRSRGLDSVDLGLCSTDELYFASGSMDAPGAMLTASHNPSEYNGIKLCRSAARPVGQDTGLGEIKERAGRGLVAADHEGSASRVDVLGPFVQHVHSFVDVESLAEMRVVADTANGMGGLVVPAVFESLPFELEVMFAELDGSFPNHPADPIQPANQADLRARVVEAGADVGLAFDGDADRVFLVDERGEGLSGSTTTAIIAAAALERNPGASVIYNLICSKAVPELIRERGGKPIRSRVGHSFIKELMAETGAVFGGEHSAHYYFADNWRADSGLIAALVVLEQLSIKDVKLSELRADFERYAGSGEINSKVVDGEAAMAAVAKRFGADAEIDYLDGMTCDFGDWWFNLRASNTEPLLRLNLEAKDVESCRDHTADVLDVVRSN